MPHIINTQRHSSIDHDRPIRPSIRPVRRIRLPPRLQGGAQLRPLPQRVRQEHPHAHGLQCPARRPGVPRGDPVPALGYNLQRRQGHDHREGRRRPLSADAEERARERGGPRRDVGGVQVLLPRSREDGHKEGRRAPRPRPGGLRQGALRDPALRQGAHRARRDRLLRAGGDVRRPARGALKGHQGEDGVPLRRRVRAEDPLRVQVPPVQVRALRVQGRLHQDNSGPRRVHFKEPPAGGVRGGLQGHRQRPLRQQDAHHIGHREDRRRHGQRRSRAALQALLGREAGDDHCLQPAVPLPAGHPGDHRRARDIAPRLLAAEALRLLLGHLPHQGHPDDRRHAFPPDDPRQVGPGGGAEAGRCASTSRATTSPTRSA